MFAGHDRSAINHQAGDIQTGQGHCAGRNGLVATNECDHAVETMAAGDQFNGIGHYLARHQGALHALRAHRNAVSDDNAAKFHGGAASGPDAFLDMFGQVAQMNIARGDIRPGVHHRDHGLINFLIIHPGGAEHGTGGCPVWSLLYLITSHYSFAL